MVERGSLSGRAFKVLGAVLTAVSVFFIFSKVWSNRLLILSGQSTEKMVALVLLGALGYAVSSVLLSTAWQRLLVWFGQTDATTRDCYVIYSRSQLAKYLPGNVFHFVGRQVLGKQAGFGQAALAGASLYEVISLIFASSVIALSGIVFFKSGQDRFLAWGIAVIFLAVFLFPLVLNRIAPGIPWLRELNFPQKKTVDILRDLFPVYLLHIIYYLALGGILLGTVYVLSGIENVRQAGIVITVFAVSWIVGFITPGSPAGAGVREFILVVSLSAFLTEPKSLVVALTYRMISLTGDFLYFLSSFAIRGRSGKSSGFL